MKFYPGFDIKYSTEKMNYIYDENTFGPEVEKRYIDKIRPSLMEPDCDGPEIVYAIAMDVGRKEDIEDLKSRNLLYGTVIYAKGKLGKEPIRSQGHKHAVSKSCNYSTPEVYEIWEGKAYIYMQETAEDNPGRCFAVEGNPGDVIIVPPGWAHATISADPSNPLVFGAWCVRDFGFDYDDVRAHAGLTFFPTTNDDGSMTWNKNPNYNDCEIILKKPRIYTEFGIEEGVSIYEQYVKDNAKFDFVKDPMTVKKLWENFIP